MSVIREVFSQNGELVRDDAIREIARMLGYRRTGPHIQEVIARDLMAASRRGLIYRDSGMYQLDCRTIDEYKRDDLVKYLAAAVGRTWHTRDEAIKAASRYLGFRRTGRNIKAAFKSAINAGIRRNLLDRDGPDYVRRT
jgi:NADH:ubiquinone oxidoreductase subunit E